MIYTFIENTTSLLMEVLKWYQVSFNKAIFVHQYFPVDPRRCQNAWFGQTPYGVRYVVEISHDGWTCFRIFTMLLQSPEELRQIYSRKDEEP